MKKDNRKQQTNSRRSFLKKATLAAGSFGALGVLGLPNDAFSVTQKEKGTPNSDDLKIDLAGYDFNRLQALVDGRVKIKSCAINYFKSGIGDMNTNMFSGKQSYDISEIGLHPFMLAYANENFRDYSLLPIFPLRIFRHKSVFIRNDRGIKKPEDLKGKTIGTAGYSSTSLTWLRGIFQDEYGIKPQDVKWVISNKDSSADAAGKISKQEQVNPEGISIIMGTAGKDESELLLSGEVDALFHAAEPEAFIKGNPLVERLFSNPKEVEKAYFSKTGIFPIMHAVAVRKTLLEEHPWLAQSIFDAYSEAKTADYNYMKKLGWLWSSLPWYGQELEETKALMGENFWTYGIKDNRKTIETLFRYSYEQGLCSSELKVEDLFYQPSLDFNE